MRAAKHLLAQSLRVVRQPDAGPDEMSACCGGCDLPQGHEPCPPREGGLLPYCLWCWRMTAPTIPCAEPDCPSGLVGQINSNTPDPGESPYEHARRIGRPTVIGR